MSRHVSSDRLVTDDIAEFSDIKNLKKDVRMFLLLLADYSNDVAHTPCLVELFSHGKLWHFCSTVAAWC